ncbi:hypothetical protein, partial [Pseudorhizobium endolithicum]
MSHPPFHTAIIRQTATSLRAPVHCPRRACRRAGACQGTIDARYEPPCVTRLTGDDRAFFRGQIGLSVLAANIFQGRRPPVPLENNEEAPADFRQMREGRLQLVLEGRRASDEI